MSDVKWIKLSTQMFEDEKIRLIESMPEADTILIVWVKLLSQAGRANNNGYIYLSENIPYTDEMLATIFNRPLGTVRMALETFRRFGMIEVDENQFISITNWEKHQNIAGLDKIREQTKKRVERHRQQKKLGLTGTKAEICEYCGKDSNTHDHIIPRSKGGTDDPVNVVKCCKSCNSSKRDKDLVDFLNDSFTLTYQNLNHEIIQQNAKFAEYIYFDKKAKRYRNVTVTPDNATEQELDLELELEKDVDVVVVEEQSPGMAFRFYENNIHPLTPHVAEVISKMIDESSEELVHESLRRAVEANAGNKIKFAEAILRAWQNKRLKTLAAVAADDKEFERRKRGNANGTTPKHHAGSSDEEYDGLSL